MSVQTQPATALERATNSVPADFRFSDVFYVRTETRLCSSKPFTVDCIGEHGGLTAKYKGGKYRLTIQSGSHITVYGHARVYSVA